MRVTIYPNDHRPTHVHVIGSGGETVFVLNCPNGPSTIRTSYGFASRTSRAIEDALSHALGRLCEARERFHGTD
jgi:hypothetical protein